MGDASTRFRDGARWAGLGDHRAEALRAKGLNGEPGLQSAKSAREVGAEVAGPDVARGEPARRARQIGAGAHEGLPMRFGIAHEKKARVIRHLQPFVKIERDRIGAIDSVHEMLQFGRQRAERAEGAVDMEPQIFRRAEIGERARESNAPVFTVPAVPTTIDGMSPAARSRADRFAQGLEANAAIWHRPAAGAESPRRSPPFRRPWRCSHAPLSRCSR